MTVRLKDIYWFGFELLSAVQCSESVTKGCSWDASKKHSFCGCMDAHFAPWATRAPLYGFQKCQTLCTQVSLEDALSNVNALHEQSLEGTQRRFYDNPFCSTRYWILNIEIPDTDIDMNNMNMNWYSMHWYSSLFHQILNINIPHTDIPSIDIPLCSTRYWILIF